MVKSAENKYLNKQANYPAQIESPVSEDLALIVVIPCYNEPDLKSTLDSLALCTCSGFTTEVIVVINQEEGVSEDVHLQNQVTLQMTENWESNSADFQLHTIYIDEIASKKAGVGYARKSGMDEALYRFDNSDSAQKIIVCLDADTIVESNYFQSIYSYFVDHPTCPAASIDYAHPIDSHDTFRNRAIMQYEMHLRYYVLAQRWSGLQYAHQTVGSAMAVRTIAYAKQGGMNTRKAGEDFYFIHKFTHFENFGNIIDTKVIPSARISDRVPFGTGRAMQSLMVADEELTTYAPQSFAAIQKLLLQLPIIYEGKEALRNAEVMSVFLRNYQFNKKLEELHANTTDYISFSKRFYAWFDAFLCMKFLHFSRDQYHPNIPVTDAANWLNKTYFEGEKTLRELELLTKLRSESKVNR